MKKIDPRLEAAARHERRRRVVALRGEGKTGLEIAAATGLSSASVSTIWKRYLAGGLAALEPGLRGRRHGEGRSLTAAQETALREIVLSKTPKMLGLVDSLWTRETIGGVAEAALGARLPTRTVSNYLHRWGMTLPQPATQNSAELSADFRGWLASGYREFSDRMRQEGSEIYWLTDTALKAVGNDTRGLRMLAAVNNRGKCRFMLCKGTMTGRIFVTFMSRLCRDAERRVCLIACTPPPRHGKAIRTWLERHKNEIGLFHMPTNSLTRK